MNLLKGKIIYQLSFRTITTEGTIKAAEKLLPHIATLGVDIVYITACFAADNDLDVSTWSERQRKSCCGNPKNPYKMADYFHVDEEYGTDRDLYDFVNTAHSCGLEVMLDLVYLHCGRNAVFIKEHPDFVQRNEDGTTLIGEQWPFARINYNNPELREYLCSNMEYFVKEFDIDGYRCDVADQIPLDFWQEGIRRIRKIKPGIYMLSEGGSSEFIEEVFDGSYHWEKKTKLIDMYNDASAMEAYKKFYEEEPYYNKTLNYFENHDVASDVEKNRYEKVFGTDGAESMMFLIYTIGGIPFIWNGQEVCDDSENCMFSNRFFGRKNYINWSNALMDKGKHRMEVIKTFSELYHSHKALYDGSVKFTDIQNAERILCFTRQKDDEKLFVCINTGDEPASFETSENPKIILSTGISLNQGGIIADPYGYMIAKID